MGTRVKNQHQGLWGYRLVCMQGGPLLHFVVHAKRRKILLGYMLIPVHTTDKASTQHTQKYCGLQYGFYGELYEVTS